MLALLLLLLAFPSPASSYEEAWAALLQRVVTDGGLVRYDLLEGPLRPELDAVAAAVAEVDAAALRTDAERRAFWMNAYNVKLIERVLAVGVPDHVERHGFEFFFEVPVRVAGHDVTLNEIEHVILRREAGPEAIKALAVRRLDPRVHVGLNCGAVSCPRLRAFTAADVDAELDRAMRDFVDSPRHVRREGGAFVLSSLLDWYGSDWELDGEAAGDVLLGFMSRDRPDYAALRDLLRGRTAAEIRSHSGVRFEYLWDLNRAAR